MNVLLMCVCRGLIVIGNKQIFGKCDLWKKWIDWVEENKLLCEVLVDDVIGMYLEFDFRFYSIKGRC